LQVRTYIELGGLRREVAAAWRHTSGNFGWRHLFRCLVIRSGGHLLPPSVDRIPLGDGACSFKRVAIGLSPHLVEVGCQKYILMAGCIFRVHGFGFILAFLGLSGRLCIVILSIINSVLLVSKI
jgi:hypothetical protein